LINLLKIVRVQAKDTNDKLLIRGYFKIPVFACTPAVPVNSGRIYRYIDDLEHKLAQAGFLFVQKVKGRCFLLIKFQIYSIFLPEIF